MSLGLRKAQKKKRKLVRGTAQDVQTSIRRSSPIETTARVRVKVTKIWKRDNKNLERVKVKNGVHQQHGDHQRHLEVRWNT